MHEFTTSQRPVIFVYQMGKVASTAIYRALLKSDCGAPVVHAHSFEAHHNSAQVRAFFQYYQLEKPKVKLISLVREPVSRNISAFFQNLKRNPRRLLNRPDDLQKIRKKFLAHYPHDIPLTWFDNNIKRHFEIDVYEKPFPDCGHVTFVNRRAELLLMRHDLSNALKEDLIAEFVGIPNLQLAHQNVSSKKSYAADYEAFQQLKLPLEHLYYLASSRYMKHFFMKQMREILEFWSEEPLPSR